MIAKRLVFVALMAATASPAFAAARLTDSQFVQASRCRALAKASSLGASDAAPFDALIKAQRQGRADYIVGKAEDAAGAVSSQARRADEAVKAGLIAERDGPCQALLAQ
jgi:hypothetical protein